MTAKFLHCHVDGNTMWCKHFSGKWVPLPLPSLGNKYKDKTLSEEKVESEEKKEINI
jgi:hypothetical protein